MFYDSKNDELRIGNIVLAIVLAIMALVLIPQSIYTVPAGNVGIVTNWGAIDRTAYPGLGMKWPISQNVIWMNIQTVKDEVEASAASKNLQVVTSKIAVNYNLDPAFALQTYQNVGTNYQDVLISPAIQNTFKSVTSQYTAEELITKREEVRISAEKALAEQLTPYHIQVQNFNIVNFDFSKEFNASIEAKQVAEQQVETSKQLLAKAKVDADTVKAQAEGQAQAQNALKQNGALSKEYLQYLALTKWDGKLPQVTGGATPFIDVSGFSVQQPTTIK